MGICRIRLRNLLLAILFFQVAIALDLTRLKSRAWYLKFTGDTSGAIEAFEDIIKIEPDEMMNYWHLAELYRSVGQFRKGWRLLLHRFDRKSSEFAQTKIVLHALQGKRIIIHREGEIGDNIFFIRYAQLLKSHGAYIIAHVHPALVPLFSLCPYLDEVTSEQHAKLMKQDHDMVLWQQSLPVAFDTTLKTIPSNIPYLFPDERLQKKWKAILSKDQNLKVGICWQANPELYLEKMTTTRRSIPLKSFENIMKLPGVTVYCLQRQHGLDQIELLSPEVHLQVFDNLDFQAPFMDTAALIFHLDLVITVDTSIAHLAGALGARTWVLLPYVSEWRWMHDREDSPWYPTMKLFRQSGLGNWDTVIEKVCQEIGSIQKKGK